MTPNCTQQNDSRLLKCPGVTPVLGNHSANTMRSYPPQSAQQLWAVPVASLPASQATCCTCTLYFALGHTQALPLACLQCCSDLILQYLSEQEQGCGTHQPGGQEAGHPCLEVSMLDVVPGRDNAALVQPEGHREVLRMLLLPPQGMDESEGGAG